MTLTRKLSLVAIAAALAVAAFAATRSQTLELAPAAELLSPAHLRLVSGDQAVGYWVYRAEVSPGGVVGQFTKVGEVAVAPGETGYRFVDRNVTNGVSYRYKVAAVFADGSTSEMSRETRDLTPLEMPRLRETRTPVRGQGAAARQAALPEWDPVPGAQGYVVQYRRAGSVEWLPYEQLVAEASPAVAAECRAGRRCAELPLPANAAYEFRVLASSSPVTTRDLSRPSDPHGAELEGMPVKPQLQVTVRGTTPTLSWPQVFGARNLEVLLDDKVVQGASSACGAVNLRVNAAERTNCTDTAPNVPVGRAITYQLRASNSLGSALSDPVTVTLVGPVSVRMSNQTTSGARFDWSAAGADSFDVFVCSDPSASGSCSSDKGSAVSGLSGTQLTGVVLNSASAPSLACGSVCGLTRMTVVARNASGSMQESQILVRALAPTPPSPRAPSGGSTSSPATLQMTSGPAPAPAPRTSAPRTPAPSRVTDPCAGGGGPLDGHCDTGPTWTMLDKPKPVVVAPPACDAACLRARSMYKAMEPPRMRNPPPPKPSLVQRAFARLKFW